MAAPPRQWPLGKVLAVKANKAETPQSYLNHHAARANTAMLLALSQKAMSYQSEGFSPGRVANSRK